MKNPEIRVTDNRDVWEKKKEDFKFIANYFSYEYAVKHYREYASK